MTDEYQKKVNAVRPPFKLASPLVATIIRIFGYGNIVLGIACMAEIVRLQNFSLINSVFSYPFWGLLFFILGVYMLYNYYKNNWKAMRRALFGGIVLKTYWEAALFFRWVTGDQDNPIVLIIWSIILALNIAAYVHFFPLGYNKDKND